jgi:hypothetical protein
MICSADILFDIQLGANSLGKCCDEVWVSIGNDLFRHSVVWEHLLCIDSGHSYGVYVFTAWEKEHCFGTVVIHNHEH